MKHRLLKPYVGTFFAFGLNQLIENPTRSTLQTAPLIDHILTNSKAKVSHYGVIYNGISNHGLIYCIRKTKTVKTGKHETTSITSYKHYFNKSFLERFKKNLDYSTLNFIDAAFTNLTFALQDIVNEIAPVKDIRVKGNSKPWFDSNIMEVIRLSSKLNERYLRANLYVDHKHLNKQCNFVQQKKIRNKKANFERNQLQNNTKKAKEQWEVLQSIGLPSKAAQISKICLKENNFT